MAKFETRIWVPAPIDEVWNFFSNPRNLAQLTPPYLNIEVESEPNIRNDLSVVIFLKPLIYPFGIKWVSKIHEVIAEGDARRFVDIQASGPFANWKHTHIFESGSKEFSSSSGKLIHSAHGGTWIIDQIDYTLPMGLLGRVIDKLFSRRNLQQNFHYRFEQLRQQFKLEN